MKKEVEIKGKGLENKAFFVCKSGQNVATFGQNAHFFSEMLQYATMKMLQYATIECCNTQQKVPKAQKKWANGHFWTVKVGRKWVKNCRVL